MSQQTPSDNPRNPALPPSAEQSADPTAPPASPAPPARRKRRRWPWVLLGIVVVLLLLVLLGPVIASTAPVRSFVVGRVNKNLNGRVAISDWSLGWTSGIDVTGVKVYDDRNAEIADIQRIKTDLTLLDAVDYLLAPLAAGR